MTGTARCASELVLSWRRCIFDGGRVDAAEPGKGRAPGPEPGTRRGRVDPQQNAFRQPAEVFTLGVETQRGRLPSGDPDVLDWLSPGQRGAARDQRRGANPQGGAKEASTPGKQNATARSWRGGVSIQRSHVLTVVDVLIGGLGPGSAPIDPSVLAHAGAWLSVAQVTVCAQPAAAPPRSWSASMAGRCAVGVKRAAIPGVDDRDWRQSRTTERVVRAIVGVAYPDSAGAGGPME